MAHIPCDDVEMLYRSTGKREWTKFEDTLKQQHDKIRGIDENTYNQILTTTQQMARSNRPFPASADELCDELNQQVHGNRGMM